jgi:hypothetical protein
MPKQQEIAVGGLAVTVFFTTKHVVPVLRPAIRKHLVSLLHKESSRRGIVLKKAIISETTVTLAMELPLDVSARDAISGLKRATASVLKRRYRELRTRIPSLWTRRQVVSAGEPSAAEISALMLEERR